MRPHKIELDADFELATEPYYDWLGQHEDHGFNPAVTVTCLYSPGYPEVGAHGPPESYDPGSGPEIDEAQVRLSWPDREIVYHGEEYLGLAGMDAEDLAERCAEWESRIDDEPPDRDLDWLSHPGDI